MTYNMEPTDRTESTESATESRTTTPKKLIFESQLWTECPKYK